jgi:hypothetical protein
MEPLHLYAYLFLGYSYQPFLSTTHRHLRRRLRLRVSSAVRPARRGVLVSANGIRLEPRSVRGLRAAKDEASARRGCDGRKRGAESI